MKLPTDGLTEEELEKAVFEYWEAGLTWNEIEDTIYIPLPELLERPAILDLYNK